MFRLFLSSFLGEAETYNFPIIFLSRAGGRRPDSLPSVEKAWMGKVANRQSLASTLLFQPQTVTPHKQHTPIEHFARGRLWVDSWSIFGQIWSKMTKPTKARPKTNRKPTQNWPSPGSRQASTPKKRGGSVAEIKVLTLAILDGRLKSQPFSQFWRIGLLN